MNIVSKVTIFFKNLMMTFIENQRFKPLLIGTITTLTIIGVVLSFIKNERETVLSSSFLIAILSIAVVFILIMSMTLKTRMDHNMIEFQMVPFVKKTIMWSDVDSLKVVDYGFVGGWGIRLGTKYGTVYNMGGNKGVAIKLKNGRKLLIGTQKEVELREFLSQMEYL